MSVAVTITANTIFIFSEKIGDRAFRCSGHGTGRNRWLQDLDTSGRIVSSSPTTSVDLYSDHNFNFSL